MEFHAYDFEKLSQNKGHSYYGYLDIARKPDGTWMRIPYVMVVGAQDGPTLVMDGGIHGDEVEGADAIAQVGMNLDPAKLKGIYLGVPHLNLEGFNIGQRMASSIDYTAADMNRIFPGDDAHGKISSTILAIYVKEFMSHGDFHVTFHSGGNTLYLEPVACYTNPKLDTDFGTLTYDMARCFMTPFLWRNNPGAAKEGGTSMRSYCEINKIAYICLEMGGNACWGAKRQELFDMSRNGIINLMNYLKMTDGEVPKFREDIVDINIDYLHITHGGIVHHVKNIYDHAKKGEVLSYVTDIFGNKIDECVAPYDGVVAGVWTPPVVQPRDWICLFGKEQD